MQTESKFWVLICIALANAVIVFGAPVISNVLAVQNDRAKTVSISYDLAHSEALAATVTIEVTFNGEYWLAVDEVTGDVGTGIEQGSGKWITWDAGAEWSAQLFPTVKVRVRADDGELGSDGYETPEGFSFINAGSFRMGSPESEVSRVADEVIHEVTLSRSFLMGKTELNFSDWTEVRDWALENGYSDLPVGRNGFEGDENGTHPVTEISWYDAVKWLNAKSEQDGFTPCYTKKGDVYRTGNFDPKCDHDAGGYRLPTEAEWEYACRAGSLEAFYTGEIVHPIVMPLDPSLDMAGWYLGNSNFNTHPVGDPQKVDNDFGLRDMHGNVTEWCWDWYGNYPMGNIIDPTGLRLGSARLKRGGAYTWDARHCRSAYRSQNPPQNSHISVGMRLVRTVVD